MKQTILWATAALCCAAVVQTQAQTFDLRDWEGETVAPFPAEAGRIFRTEVIPFDTRAQADARNRANSDGYLPFQPDPLSDSGDGIVEIGQMVDFPFAWTSGLVYLHLENVGAAYTLKVNDKIVANVEDSSTPAEFALTPYLHEGQNAVGLLLRQSPADELNVAPSSRKSFDNSYFYTQDKRSIRDFEMALVPDSTRKFGILQLTLFVQNQFNYDEKVTVGYDIYAPDGKLLDYNIVDRNIPGLSIDTVRLHPYIYNTYNFKWQAGAKNPPLYKVMLFTRRDGVYHEYMPMKIGFGKTEFVNGDITRFDKALQLTKTNYNAAVDRKTTLTELKALKIKGINTICPDAPQPAWFYEICDELGLYVIDRANIAASDRRTDRTVGGTPANNPALAQEFVQRVKAMYYRSRNYTCVIAYALGGEAGNGYNMYKAYEWLKSVEKSRPVIYIDADGEWNSDQTMISD